MGFKLRFVLHIVYAIQIISRQVFWIGKAQKTIAKFSLQMRVNTYVES